MVRYRAANAMAPIPFDRHGVPGTIEIVDDFVTASTTADYTQTGAVQESEFLWWGSEIGTNDATANGLVIPGEGDHPGILQLQTGATTPGDGDGVSLQLGNSTLAIQDSFVLDTNGVYVAAVLRVLDVDDQSVGFGLIGQTPAEANSSAADVIEWVWDPADVANVGDELWIAQVNGASTDVEAVVSDVAYVEGDWVLLEIAADTSSATFRITTEDGTETITIDSTDGVVMPTVALRPYFGTCNISTAENLLDIDLFVMRYIRRDALVAGWLGA